MPLGITAITLRRGPGPVEGLLRRRARLTGRAGLPDFVSLRLGDGSSSLALHEREA
jgi:hypothetical protein